ncbi:hypothetical protein ACFQ80_05915 [Isoptericola sp. NPDC056578]|uniref:hypothetical protein n=1 Tax=Isoptericola sp. NPDC056578 TaxID=3345870 RepID=UPI0036A324A8
MAQDSRAARWYTRARRIPILIGRTSEGSKIPGGPYTLGQVIAFFAIVFGLWKTIKFWAVFDGVTNATIFIAIVAGAVYGMGKLPRSGRNPLSWTVDFAALTLRAPGGKVNGKPLPVSKPRRLRHRVVTPQLPPLLADDTTGEPEADMPTAEPSTTQHPPKPTPEVAAPEPAAPTGRQTVQLTAVGRLLANANTQEDS